MCVLSEVGCWEGRVVQVSYQGSPIPIKLLSYQNMTNRLKGRVITLTSIHTTNVRLDNGRNMFKRNGEMSVDKET